MEEDDDFGSLRDADVHDKQDKEPLHGTKHRQAFQSNATRVPARNSSLDLYEDSTGKAAYNITKNHRKDTKRGVEGMRSDSASNHSDQYEENIPVKHADFLPYEYENTNPKNAQRSVHAEFLQYDYDSVNPKNAQRSENVKTKPSNSIHNSNGSAPSATSQPLADLAFSSTSATGQAPASIMAIDDLFGLDFSVGTATTPPPQLPELKAQVSQFNPTNSSSPFSVNISVPAPTPQSQSSSDLPTVQHAINNFSVHLRRQHKISTRGSRSFRHSRLHSSSSKSPEA